VKSQSLSFVLPITLEENAQEFEWRDNPDKICGLRFQLLLKSFLRTFNLEELDLFLIVCPASDEKKIRDMLRRTTTDSRFQVMKELDLCPELNEQRKKGKDISGWYIQQIIKLAVANTFSTSFYLTLDNDILCRNPFSINSLIPRGKALLNVETLGVYLRAYKTRIALNEWQIKRHRLICSAGLLGYKRKWRYRHQSYGETPVLMHTNSVMDLTSFLSQRHDNWVHYLTENSGWTEDTLFFQFLEMNGSLNKFYQKGDHNTVLDLDSSVWRNSDEYNQKRDYSPRFILSCKNERAGTFVAIQSYLTTDKWLPSEYNDLDDFYSDLEEYLLDSKSF